MLASQDAYTQAVERLYALSGVGGEDYVTGQGALSREKIEAELGRRNVWADVGEVGGLCVWAFMCVCAAPS